MSSKRIGETVKDVASKFEFMDEPQRTKCRFLYLHAKIETIQNRGQAPSDELMSDYNEIENELRNQGYSPQTILYRTN